jgi:hypothetical protein
VLLLFFSVTLDAVALFVVSFSQTPKQALVGELCSTMFLPPIPFIYRLESMLGVTYISTPRLRERNTKPNPKDADTL